MSEAPGAVREASPEEVAAKAAGARRAALAWRRAGVAQRASILREVWSALAARRAEAIAVIQEETGKPALEAELAEFGSAGLLVKYYASNAERLLGERAAWTPWFQPNKRAAVRRLPRGVVGIISPSSSPFLVPFSDAFCAILAGNAALLKPSEWTTRTALWLESVVSATGLLPEGLLSVVPGRAGAGEGVVDASDLVLFTGSAAAGRAVAARAAARLKPALLTLGGAHSMIVCADAPLERAAAAAAWGVLSNAGPACVGSGRVFAEAAVHDAFAAKVRARLGSGREAVPFVDPSLLVLAQAQLEDARAKGGLVGGGEIVDRARSRMAPALILNAAMDMSVMSGEAVGPALPIMKVARAEEAVALANSGAGGLAASVWTADPDRADRLVAGLDAGLVGINEPAAHYALGSVPFGGTKGNGLWRRHGDEGLLALTQAQSLIAHEWPADVLDPWWFPRGPRVVAALRAVFGLR